VPLAQVRLAINLDMIGRLRNHRLEVYGTRTAPGLRRLVSLQNESDLRLDFNWSMIDDSDHYSFYERGIPCLMLHTDKHEDYHRPSDDIQRVNYEGAQSISRLLLRVVSAAADAERLPVFRPEIHSESITLKSQLEAPLPPLPSRLGVAWSAERAGEGVVELTEVTPGSAADRAGLRRGDRIIRFEEAAIDDADDFRRVVLAARNPVTVLVERRGATQAIPLQIELAGQPVQLGIAWRVDPAEPQSVVVCRVVAGSPAQEAGLRVGDRIYRIDGEDFRADIFRERLANSGESPTLLIEREGTVRELNAAHRRAAGMSRSVKPRGPAG
jgi:membrane-associated protease RseP (regulator of RpoE activity)